MSLPGILAFNDESYDDDALAIDMTDAFGFNDERSLDGGFDEVPGILGGGTYGGTYGGAAAGGADGGAAAVLQHIVGSAEVGECALNAPTQVCSSDTGVDAMRSMIEQKTGKDMAAADNVTVVETAKRITSCDSEACLYNVSSITQFLDRAQRAEELNNFKPVGPAHSTDWLNNFNIDNIGAQLANRFEGFRYLPMCTIDFMDYNSELSRVSLHHDDLRGAQYGVVVNTDVRSGPGIHWFAIFIDGKSDPPVVELFDSSGSAPNPRIYRWLASQSVRMPLSAKGTNRTQYVQVTSQALQKDNHSCGVWSLSYIWGRLSGVRREWFASGKVTDEEMLRFRQYFFRE